jgi:hypothetical protein
MSEDWGQRFGENDYPLERLNKSCDQLIYKPKPGTTHKFAFCLKRNKFDFRCRYCRGI